jgi:SAM-dependent methyltransferase
VSGEILAATAWPTNADMIVDCVTLGYIHGRVLDPTYGKGNWWNLVRPIDFHAHDLKVDGVDFRNLPYPDGYFDTITFDPPYKLNGTPTDAVDAPYGVDIVATRAGRTQLILDGMVELARVLAPEGHLLVKCQNQVNGGKVRWQTRDFAAHGEMLGLTHLDELQMLAYREQPAGVRQVHARRNYSTLLIFQAPRTVARARLL